jgi:glycosyltransferase involved in cell wall biosynthesis
MSRPHVFLLIDEMLKGGAETLLAGTIPALSASYRITLVTLGPGNAFPEIIPFCEQHLMLPFRGIASLPACVWALRKHIRVHQPDLVHAHLFWSSMIGRLACPKRIPFLQTIHSIMSEDVFRGSRLLTWLEKQTLQKRHGVIAVSQPVLADYQQCIGKTDFDVVLPNHVDDRFMQAPPRTKPWDGSRMLRLVAVGNIKSLKNYRFLLDSILLSHVSVGVDVYGKDQANLLPTFNQTIAEHELPVRFMGLSEITPELLQNYDAFILPSLYEGFGIAAVEAMASGLPVLVSDLPVLRQVTGEQAFFFDPHHPASLDALWRKLYDQPELLPEMASRGQAFVRDTYSREKAISHLLSVYRSRLK